MSKPSKPKGAVSIIFSILLLILFGFAAIAVDIGYMAVAKSELQNAADAGARAGALRFYEKGTGPNWANVQQRAEELAELNPSTGSPVVLASAPEIGYWNLATGGQAIQSPVGFSPTAQDLPAVKVTASRTGAGDGGPISTLFARTLNIDSAPLTASAIAVVSGPGYVDQRSLFPFVMSQCMYNAYWDASATPPGPILDGEEPKIFYLGSNKDIAPCDTNTGTWTSLLDDTMLNAGKGGIGGIIDHFGTENPGVVALPVSIEDMVWVKSGLAATLYGDTQKCSAVGDKRCQFVTIAVVSDARANNNPSQTMVRAFACLEILDGTQGGSGATRNTIKVRMTRNCDPPGSGGIGPDYGFKPKPRIVQ